MCQLQSFTSQLRLVARHEHLRKWITFSPVARWHHIAGRPDGYSADLVLACVLASCQQLRLQFAQSFASCTVPSFLRSVSPELLTPSERASQLHNARPVGSSCPGPQLSSHDPQTKGYLDTGRQILASSRAGFLSRCSASAMLQRGLLGLENLCYFPLLHNVARGVVTERATLPCGRRSGRLGLGRLSRGLLSREALFLDVAPARSHPAATPACLRRSPVAGDVERRQADMTRTRDCPSAKWSQNALFERKRIRYG